MAAPHRILSLNLGTQTLGVAEFKTGQNGGLVLTAYQTRELLADPAADATRLAQAKLVLGEMVSAMGYKGARVNYSVSSQSVFTRFVKLPSVGEEQVDQIVTFEAQQNVPYPINEVVWDYQLVDSGSAAQIEVVIVAIKADLLDEINDTVEASGLRTSLVDVAPMAAYNAFRYNYSELTGCSLIIDIGSRTTNLIFVEPNKVFSRSIPTGGNTITSAIAKDFNEPFGAAEERKKTVGFVSLGGSYAEPDDADTGRVSKMIRTTMTRLHAEISRSISFYRSQQSGSQPVRVFLSGGSATLPYMREFFSEKFSLPVEFFNPLRNVAVGPGLNIEEIGRNAHNLGELVGLSLRGISNCPMEMNLRPAGVVRRHQLSERRPFMLLAGVCLLLTLAAFWLFYDRAATATEEAAEKLTPQVTTLKGFESRMSGVRNDIKAQEDTILPLLTAVKERDYWVKVINDINARLPQDYVWVTGFEPKIATPVAPRSGGKGKSQPPPAATPQGLQTVLTLSGLYLANPRGPSVVDDFVNKLGESELYAVNKADLKRSVPNEAEWAFDFEVPLILKNPIQIPTGAVTTATPK